MSALDLPPVVSATRSTEIERELSPGERLVWHGQPRSGIRLRGSDAFLIPFSLVWCSFAIFWEVSVIIKGAPFWFMLWGIPFVLIGMFFVFGRFFADARTRARTFYGLTSERIIIVSGLFSRRTKYLNLRTLSEISLTERSDGSGTITFGPAPLTGQRMLEGWPGASSYGAPSFEMIEQVRETYKLIRQAQGSLRAQ